MVSTAWAGNYCDDTHGKVFRCLTFVCDSEVMLVLDIVECLRSTMLLLDCLIARLLCLLRRLFNCINIRRLPTWIGRHTFSAFFSSFSADFSALPACATCFSSTLVSFAIDRLTCFSSRAVKICGASDGFVLVAPSMTSQYDVKLKFVRCHTFHITTWPLSWAPKLICHNDVGCVERVGFVQFVVRSSFEAAAFDECSCDGLLWSNLLCPGKCHP